jgi:bacitracin synthase 3
MVKMKPQFTNYLTLTSNQNRLWIVSQQDRTNPAYNLQLTYHFNGAVVHDIFNKSVGLLFERHHTMFSVFKYKDGAPYIEIIPSLVCVELIDYSDEPIGTSKEKIFGFAIEDSRRYFDIENGPLYRLYLLKENENSYYFHATIHHIIFDGWSRRIFVQELSRIYSSLTQAVNDKIKPLVFHSYNYAELEGKLSSSEEEANLIKFWKDNLKNCPPEIRLPYDYARGIKSKGLGRRESFVISEEDTRKLRKLSIRAETSLFNTVLSILGIFFQKYSGENDICIGVPVSNRRLHPELEKIFGLFINTTVVRLKINDKIKFSDYLQQTRSTIRNAISHSNLSFEKIVDAVNPERIPGINPLFQVSLSWLTGQTIPMNFGNVKGERITLPEGISPFDFTFYMWEDENIVKGDIEYNIDIFKPETILRLKDNLLHLVHTLTSQPDRIISEVSVLSKAEKNKINQFNETIHPVSDCLVHEFFEFHAAIHPEKRAISSGDSRLTYNELNERSNQIADYLIKLGVKGGDAVGICLERTVDMAASVLGVLKAGCCYLPMDPSFPNERIKYMFEDSGAKVLITQDLLKDKFIQFVGNPIVLIDTDKGKINKNSTKNPYFGIDNQSLAYIIYTSGSTGKPKGVKVQHQAVVNFLNSMLKKPGFTIGDRLLAVTTLSFDISVLELFLPLSSGAEVVIAETDEVLDGHKLSRLLSENDITVMQATPAMWNILLDSGWIGKKNLKALCGGEVIPPSLVKNLLPRVESLWDMYGPTETTVWSTCSQLTDAEPPILVGKPIDNTSIYILDRNNNLLPIGVVGEVCIGGLGVTKGYHNRLELTAEKFMRFENGEVIYKTGDLGRYLADGNIELFGRSDNQIKLRGFRIEPGEIESILTGLSNVKEAVVKVQKLDENDERLVAFLNADESFKMSSDDIQGYLADKLPQYMIPNFYHVSDGFPRLPNGKINKKALIYEIKELDLRRDIDLDSLTNMQQKLLTLWCQILKMHNISLSDNFFNIGGNSLLGIRLINRVREEFGTAITFMEFLSNPTIGLMGAFLDDQTEGKEKGIVLEHLIQTDRLPLTSNQKRLWLISQFQPDIPTYIIRLTYRFHGLLNRGVFEQSLGILFERHHIVFSVIKEEGGVPYCEIVPREINVSFLDYSGLPEEIKSGKVTAALNEDSRQAFNLSLGPLYRLFLIKTAEDEYYFHMSIHHIIFDKWSQSVFVNDLSEIYNSLINGKESVLEALKYQQYDYAQWETTAAIKEESITFWEENLRDCSQVLNFPYDYQRSGKPTGRGGLEEIRLSKALSDDLKRISKEEGSSLFATLLSVFGAQMHKYSSEDDLNIGLPVTHRPHSKLEQIFGMFVNTVVVRLKYKESDTFRDLIRRTNEAALNAISNQDVPFETVVEKVKPERISNTNPLFQVAFTWQNEPYSPMNLEGIRSEVVKVTERASIFDFTLYLWDNGEIIEGEIEYNKDLLKPETIDRLKKHFINLLNSMVSEINVSVSLISLISDEELKMIDSVNDTFKEFTDNKTIIQLFESTVKLNPQNVAIEFDADRLSYSELNAKANQLAGVLQTYEIGNGDFVGILLKRSPELIITLLALFKIGAAYVPLNLTDPENRIVSILNSAKIKYVITNSDNTLILHDNHIRLNIEQLASNAEGILLNGKNITLNPTDSAYIIFTSGTTGTPKGVWVNHRSVVNLIEWVNETFKISNNDKLLWVTNLSFDLSVYDIFGILVAGGIVRILSDEDRLDPQKQYEIILREGITFWDSAPQALQQVAQYFKRTGSNHLFDILRLVFLSGDWIPLSLPPAITSNFPSAVVVGLGGATEATVWSNYYIMGNILPEWKSVPYGKPIQNSRYYILDDNLNHCWIKRPGNLYIGGECLALGYFNDPELTNMKFIQDPFNSDSKLYLTGDKAQWMPDGNIEFLGRDDGQLKVRGYRVELGEIKNVVLRNHSVKEAIVIPDKTDRHNIKVNLFYITHDNISLEIKDLRKELRESLPDYMIPSEIIQCIEFPMTSNGKIDSKALLSGYIKSSSECRLECVGEKSEEKEIPLTPTQKVIHEIWREVLGVKNILVTDDFFDLGGDSIKSIQVVSRMRNAGYELKISDVMGHSLLEAMASRAKELRRIIDQEVVSGDVFLSPIQQAFLKNDFVAGGEKEKNHFNQSFLLHFKKGITKEEVEVIFREIVEHHDALRIVFRKDECFWKQYNHGLDVSPFEFQKYDLRNEKDAYRQLDYLSGILKSSIDIEQGPLMKLGLFQLDDGDRLLITIHHLVIDLVSWRILFDDISTLLQQYRTGMKLSLPIKTDSFQRWMQKNADYVEGYALRQELDYWQAQERKKVDILPIKHKDGSNLNLDVVSSGFTLSQQETAFVQACLNGKNKVEINTILLASLGQSLQKVFGINTLKVNLEGHGREEFVDDVDVSRTVGWFTCMYPITLELPTTGIVDVAGLLILDETLKVVPKKGVGYGLIKYLSKHKLEYSQTPAQITFNYSGGFDRFHGSDDSSNYSLSDLSHGSDLALRLKRGVELDITGKTIDGRLSMSIQYSIQRYDKETLDAVTDLYKTELLRLADLLSKNSTRITVPSDFTYKGLSIGQIKVLEQEYGKIEDVYSLSPMQEGLYFIALSYTQSSAYFVQLGYRVAGRLDEMKMQESYKELITRHAVLRTVFRNDINTDLLQIVRSEAKPDFRFIDISIKSKDEQVTYLKEYWLKDRLEGFDLTKGQLIRLTVLRLSEEEHQMVWSNHHLILDGWSSSAMRAEFDKLYESKVRGLEYKLPILKPYSDYIAWLSKFDKESCNCYWREYLEGYDSLSSIPADKIKKDKDKFSVINHEFKIPEQITKQIQLTAIKYKCTLNTIMQSVWGILLSRYNNTNDVVFGSVVSGRPTLLKGAQDIFGLFINTVPQRIRYQTETRFSDLIQIVQQSFIEGEPFHHMNLAEVQSLSQIGSGLLDHLMVFENYPISGNTLGIEEDVEGLLNVEVGSSEVFEQLNYDFSLLITPGKELFVKFKYNGEAYTEQFVRRLENQFRLIINNIVENPDQLISEISVISEDERQYLLKTLNDTKADYPKDKTIVDLFEQQVNETPKNTAVIFEDTVLTYEGLNQLSNQLGDYLIKNYAIKPDDLVGIKLERSEWMIVAIMGVLKSGGAYLPMDPDYPKERIEFMVSDSSCRVLIDDKELEKFKKTQKKYSKKNRTTGLKPNNLLYCIYTSGSTGNPKGVLIEHRNVVRLLKTDKLLFDFNSNDVWTMFHSYCFDFSVWEIFGSILFGAKVVVIPKMIAQDSEAFLNLLIKESVTILNQTPSAFYNLIDSESKRNVSKLNLRYIIFGGEALQPGKLLRWKSKYKDTVLVNMYGITETTVHVTYKEIGSNEIASGLSNIGTPIPTLTCYILNEHQKLLPVGTVGELCIGGSGLARGYLNQLDLTAEKFIYWEPETGKTYNNEDKPETAIRVYRSGDLGRWLPEGNLEYLGRLDDQVKIRGFRVELGEIESVLQSHSGVSSTVVIAKPISGPEKELIAYTVGPAEGPELRDYLKEKLPSYMVPGYYVKMDSIPLTSNGKVNRKALPLPEGSGVDLSQYIVPSTAIERTLVKIWGRVLGISEEKISVKADFFDMGGNSLLGIRLINRIREELGITLAFRDILSFSTIEQLGVLIDNQIRGKEKDINLVHLTRTDHLPLTSNQKRLWLITKLQPDVPMYIIPLAFKFQGFLNCEIFQKSLEILFERHHIVFSVIKEDEGEPYCEIIPKGVKVTFIDYTELPKEEKLEKVKKLLNEVSRRVFDLGQGPLSRLYLIKTAEDEHYFHMTIHHIIFDGWSQGVLVNDLSKIYNSLIKGEEVELEVLEYQQYDYAQWEANAEIIKEESVAFWKENLRGCSPVLNFPYDFPRTEMPSGRGSFETVHLSQDLSDKLRQISKVEGSSLFTTILSVFGIQMQKYSGEDDINIGLPVVYRPHSKLENIIGMFVNTVVVRLKNETDLTFRDIIHQTNEAALNAISHQNLSFEKVVDLLNPERSSGANPLFQVAFAWQNNLSVPIKLDGIKSETIKGKERAPIFDITFYLWENGDVIEGEIEYNMDVLKTETIIRLKDHFLILVNNLVANIDIPVSSVSMISEEEKKIIESVNDTYTDYPRDKTICQLFEEQVKLFPDKTAVSFRGSCLTYKQLNERANQLSHTLRNYGVTNNELVGLLVEKSIEMIVGILGILKSGGGYVPIDPEYPEQRINFIIKDSGCNFLLVQDKFIKVKTKGVKRINLNSPFSFSKVKSNLERINSSSDLAYIMYTSGTSGMPKGSMILQYSVVRLVQNTNYIKLTSTDNILLTGAIVFDATTFEIWGALLNGGTLYIVEKETILDPDVLGEELLKNDITILWLTSPLFTHIAEQRTDIFGKLKYLLIGGDVLSAPHINKVRKDNPNLKVINGYGPTENTTFSTTYMIERDFDHNIPIGRPISNSTAYIFDNNMNYQPIGIIGELYVGGDGLSKGYLNREDLNKTSFIDHPYVFGQRLYRTGDLAKWLPDSNIEFHGRVDNQLKIRGFRVELEEIESVISNIDGIIETVIKPVKVEEGDYRLIAFLNVPEMFTMDSKDIRMVIKAKLPSYMIPSAYMFMHGFPKTINGKTDKNALTYNISSLIGKENHDLGSLTPTEIIIFNIWGKALKTEEISVKDNFFDIGGNSLMAISVISEIESAFNINLELRVFFNSPRIKDLAEIIDVIKYEASKEKLFKKYIKNNSNIIRGEI